MNLKLPRNHILPFISRRKTCPPSRTSDYQKIILTPLRNMLNVEWFHACIFSHPNRKKLNIDTRYIDTMTIVVEVTVTAIIVIAAHVIPALIVAYAAHRDKKKFVDELFAAAESNI